MFCSTFSVGEVRAYMSKYLDQAQQVLANSPAHEILDVCTLFIHCIEVRTVRFQVSIHNHLDKAFIEY